MAIPFNLPSDQEMEDNYLRLDQLLLDLYEMIRIILMRTGRTSGEERTVDAEEESGDREVLLMRVEETRRREAANGYPEEALAKLPRSRPPPKAPPRPTALFDLGIQVTLITNLYASNRRERDGVTEKKNTVEVRLSGLVSLLVPGSLGRSLWTTVLLLVGWKLLSGHR